MTVSKVPVHSLSGKCIVMLFLTVLCVTLIRLLNNSSTVCTPVAQTHNTHITVLRCGMCLLT